MTAAIVASSPERPRSSRPGPDADRAAGARTWALTRMAFRELVPVQGAIQALGVVVVTGLLAAQASGLIAGLLTLGGEPVGVFNLSAYGLTAFVVALYASFTHGIVMAARTPALLRAGLTRGAVMTWLTCTGLLLGAASTALCGLLTIPDVVLDGRIEGVDLVVVPQLAVLAIPAVALSYLVGACVALLFQRRPWWVGVIAILVGLNTVAACVGRIVAQWGTPWIAVWIALATALVAVAGPLGAWMLLRRYEPRT